MTKTKVNIFVDMDGVLAVHDPDIASKMYDKGFFLNLPAHKGNISLVKSLVKDKALNVYILSAVMNANPWATEEKGAWLDKFIPEIKKKNRFFVPEGTAKSDYIDTNLESVGDALNILIDDYTVNLLKWKEDGYLGLKMLNGKNNTSGVWLANNPKSSLNYRSNPQHNYKKITEFISTNYKEKN